MSAGNFVALPWVMDPIKGIGLGVPLRTVRTSTDRLEIRNDCDNVLASTSFTPETRMAVIATNNYAVAVMNTVDQLRAGDWDYVCASHIKDVVDMLPLLREHWWALKDTGLAPLIKDIIPSPKFDDPLMDSIRTVLNGAHFMLTDKKRNLVSMSIRTTDDETPLIALPPLSNTRILARLLANCDVARARVEDMKACMRDGVSISADDYDEAIQIKSAAKENLNREIKSVSGPEIKAIRTGWDLTVIPTLNGCSGCESLNQLPLLVKALRDGWRDVYAHGERLRSYDSRIAQEIMAAAERAGSAVACMDDKQDRNQQLLNMSSEERQKIYHPALKKLAHVFGEVACETGARSAPEDKKARKRLKKAAEASRSLAKGQPSFL